MAYESSQGIVFKFNGVKYTATSVAVAKSRGDFALTSTDITGTGSLARYRPGGLMSLEIKVDWIGKTIPPTDDLYAITFDDGSVDPTDGDLDPNMNRAVCTGLQITAQAGELIKGSATFKVSKD